MLGKKVPKSVVEKILEYNLSAEQLEEIRQCVESGLADAEILQVMENSPSPERMKKNAGNYPFDAETEGGCVNGRT